MQVLLDLRESQLRATNLAASGPASKPTEALKITDSFMTGTMSDYRNVVHWA